MTDPDRLLDEGAPGLEFFAAYLPCAHRIGVAGHVSVEYLRERYDEQRGLDTAMLAADAPVLTGLAAHLTAVVDEQVRGVHALGEAWTGGAGTVAHEDVANTAARGDGIAVTVRAVAAATAAAADGIVAVVSAKAGGTAAFAGSTIGGRTAEDVGLIISGADGIAGVPQPGMLAQWCAESGTPAPDPDSVSQWCRTWLREVFEPEFGSAIGRFTALCDEADGAVQDLLAAVARAFDDLDASPRDPGAPPRSTDPTWPADRAAMPRSTMPGSAMPGSVAPADAAANAAQNLVDAGYGLAAAVTDLAAAVTDLAAAAVDVAADGIESVVATGSCAVGPEPPVAAEPQPDAAEPQPDAAGAAPAPPVPAVPPVPESPVPTDPAPPTSSSQETGAQETGPQETGAPGGTAGSGPVARGSGSSDQQKDTRGEDIDPDGDGNEDGGIVLAEAGPL